MKRIISTLLTTFLALSMFGCSSTNGSTESTYDGPLGVYYGTHSVYTYYDQDGNETDKQEYDEPDADGGSLLYEFQSNGNVYFAQLGTNDEKYASENNTDADEYENYSIPSYSETDKELDDSQEVTNYTKVDGEVVEGDTYYLTDYYLYDKENDVLTFVSKRGLKDDSGNLYLTFEGIETYKKLNDYQTIEEAREGYSEETGISMSNQWDESYASEFLPEPTQPIKECTSYSDAGDFKFEGGEAEFKAYVQQCKDAGYTEDAQESDTKYSAYKTTDSKRIILIVEKWESDEVVYVYVEAS